MKIFFILLASSILISVAQAADTIIGEKYYININMNLPDKEIPYLSWSLSWTIGTNIIEQDSLVDHKREWVEESGVLRAYNEALNRDFLTHTELFDFLKRLKTDSVEFAEVGKVTLKLFGVYSVATHAEHHALNMRKDLQSADPEVQRDLGRYLKEGGDRAAKKVRDNLELAYRFDLKVCGIILSKMSNRRLIK